jgi:hypothetical protein
VVNHGILEDDDEGCPQSQANVRPGSRADFMFSLKGSGDGKEITIVTLGTQSVHTYSNWS